MKLQTKVSSNNRLQFLSKNTHIFLPVLLFIILWVLMNNSYFITRDEMWYNYYSELTIKSNNQDIWFLGEYDAGQVGFLVPFRYLQGISVTIFGENILGLRILNLFFGTLMIGTVGWVFQQASFPTLWPYIFTALITFDRELGNVSHAIRPDWLVLCLATVTVALLFAFLEHRNYKVLLMTAVVAGFSTGIHWNGFAVVGSLVIVMIYFLIKKVVPLKVFFGSLTLLLASVLTLLIPLLINLRETAYLFQLEGTDTNRLTSGAALTGYINNLLWLLINGFSSGRYNLLLGMLLISAIVFTIILLFEKRVKTMNKLTLTTMFAFYIVAVMILSLRGVNAKFTLVVFNGILIFWMLLVAAYLKNNTIGMIKHFRILVMVIIFLFLTANAHRTIDYALSHQGQWQAYQKYGSDLSKIISNDKGRVVTTFDHAWALKEHNKLFIEALFLNSPESSDQLNQLFEKHNVSYVLVNSRQISCFADRNKCEDWYGYLKDLLKENYKLIERVYNSYYPDYYWYLNKEYLNEGNSSTKEHQKPLTEIWKIRKVNE